MNREQHQKVTPRHLKRAALLYVRQSTMRQVFENTESTKRQYGLRDRAVALGWPRDEIVVVDGDLGHTATAAGDREGFERVVTEVVGSRNLRHEGALARRHPQQILAR